MARADLHRDPVHRRALRPPAAQTSRGRRGGTQPAGGRPGAEETEAVRARGKALTDYATGLLSSKRHRIHETIRQSLAVPFAFAGIFLAVTIAVVGEVPLARLWHAVPAYPTISELWLRWLEAYGRPH